MNLFNGRKEAEKLDKVFKKQISSHHPVGFLGIVQVGENAVSEKYIKVKTNLFDKLGIKYRVYRINSDLSDSMVAKKVKKILKQKELAGIIIQLPLPRESLNYLLNIIPPNKDLDLLSNKSLTQLKENKAIFHPPVVRALKRFLAVNKMNLEGLDVKIIGAGRLVGLPVSYFLLNNKASVTILDERPGLKEDFAGFDQVKLASNYQKGKELKADLALSATNQANLIQGEDLRVGTSFVDFGSTMKEGKITGNFDLNSQKEHLENISLVPGGMGPLVVRYLALNFLGIEREVL